MSLNSELPISQTDNLEIEENIYGSCYEYAALLKWIFENFLKCSFWYRSLILLPIVGSLFYKDSVICTRDKETSSTFCKLNARLPEVCFF